MKKIFFVPMILLSQAAIADCRLVIATLSAPQGSDAIVKASEAAVRETVSDELAFYNETLDSLKLPKIGDVTINLTYSPHSSFPVGGQTDSKNLVSVTYEQTPIDISIAAHEIGHVIQKTVGVADDQIIYDVNNINNISIIIEGVANLAAALYLDNPKVAAGEFFDEAFNVDTFVSIKDDASITNRSWFQGLVGSPDYATHAPESAKSLQGILAANASPILSEPQAYIVSDSFAQPLWILGQKHGRRLAAQILFEAFSTFKDFSKVENFQIALVAAAKKLNVDQTIVNELQSQFTARGF